MKALLILLTIVLSSCSSSVKINAPYDKTQQIITDYFEKRAEPKEIIIKKENGEEVNLTLKTFKPNIKETEKETVWRIHLDLKLTKTPTFLTLTFKNKSFPILYAEVRKMNEFSRQRDKEEYWLKYLKNFIENETKP